MKVFNYVMWTTVCVYSRGLRRVDQWWRLQFLGAIKFQRKKTSNLSC